MAKKVDFVWELPGGSWRWTATEYQGHGIFFGKVTSPYTSEGEYGTWYYWEIVQNGAVLIKGNKILLNRMLEKKSVKKAMAYQQMIGR